MLTSVDITNYRNLTVGTKLARANVLIAPNSFGKSNFLEAIYFSNFGRVFRPLPTISDLVGSAAEFARIDLSWSDEPLLRVIISGGARLEKRFEVGGKRQKFAQVIGRHNVLLFAPTTLDLISGEPQLRRSDLDDYLGLLDPEYLAALERYNVALKSRNAILKMMQEGRQLDLELAHYTEELIKRGDYLYLARRDFFDSIGSNVAMIGDHLFGLSSGSLEVIYQPNTGEGRDYQKQLRAKFQQNDYKERAAGKTLYGVHKDEYQFLLRGSDLRYRGSRGQQRIGGLTFKLAQLEYLTSHKNVPSLMLLDDLMSELDVEHRESSAEYLLSSEHQFIITSAEITDLPGKLLQECSHLSL